MADRDAGKPGFAQMAMDAVTGGKVWVVDEDRARMREVTTGIAGSDRIEVLTGLAAGETIIVTPPEGLEEGDKVRQ